MRRASNLLAAILLAPLCGCVEQVDYYHPTAVSGLPSGIGRCDTVNRGMAFIADYSDKRRYFLVSVLAISGNPPTVDIVIYKAYHWERHDYWGFGDAKKYIEKIRAEEAPLEAWSHDRTRPYSFSTNKIEVTWQNGGHASFTLPGLSVKGDHFEGAGNSNPIIVPFDVNFKLTGFSGDWFDVTTPSVTSDDVTITPPTVHFTHTKSTAISAINC